MQSHVCHTFSSDLVVHLIVQELGSTTTKTYERTSADETYIVGNHCYHNTYM